MRKLPFTTPVSKARATVKRETGRGLRHLCGGLCAEGRAWKLQRGLSSQGEAEECSGPAETRGPHSSGQRVVLGQILWEDSTGTTGQEGMRPARKAAGDREGQDSADSVAVRCFGWAGGRALQARGDGQPATHPQMSEKTESPSTCHEGVMCPHPRAEALVPQRVGGRKGTVGGGLLGQAMRVSPAVGLASF